MELLAISRLSASLGIAAEKLRDRPKERTKSEKIRDQNENIRVLQENLDEARERLNDIHKEKPTS